MSHDFSAQIQPAGVLSSRSNCDGAHAAVRSRAQLTDARRRRKRYFTAAPKITAQVFAHTRLPPCALKDVLREFRPDRGAKRDRARSTVKMDKAALCTHANPRRNEYFRKYSSHYTPSPLQRAFDRSSVK